MNGLLLATGPASADPVAGGREALQQGAYPWYDPATDSLRRVDIPPPRDWSWLDGLDFGGFSPLAAFSFTWVVWGVLLVALAALIVALVVAYRRRDRSEADSSPPESQADAAAEAARVEALPFPVESGPLDFLAETQRAYDAGDFGRAVLYLFSHQLVQLDKNHRIRLAKGKTNRQYLRELGATGPLRQIVEPTMRVFEDFFFGNHEIDRGRFESCWFQIGRFTALLAEERP